MHRIVIITGTPGTGKTTLARSLEKAIKGSVVISANDVIKANKLYTGYDEYGTMIANMGALKKALDKSTKQAKGTVIIEGHLLCDISMHGAIAMVPRCHLKDLEKRLKRRGYKGSKLSDNVISEALDYCGINASENYKHVFEIMGNRQQMLKDALSIINGKVKKPMQIELSEELLRIGIK